MSLTRASVSGQRRFAGLLWTLPGLGLSIVGARWVFLHASGWTLGLWLLGALALGLGKGRFLRARPAARVLDRITSLGPGSPLGAFVGWKGLLLLAIMMGAGRLLRMSPLPREILGALYLGIGIALLYASLAFWRARAQPEPVATS